MKYVGFEIPSKDWGQLEWLYDVVEDRGNTIFYEIEAKNIDEARKKVFKEIYNQEWDKDDREAMSNYRAWTVLQDLEESEVLKKYGDHDGQLIIKISCEYLDLDEEFQKECIPNNKLITQLAETTIYELAFEHYCMNIGIAKIKKNL